jgi:hypothetical protein
VLARGVAQPGSALRSGRRGPQFKSGHPDHRAAGPLAPLASWGNPGSPTSPFLAGGRIVRPFVEPPPGSRRSGGLRSAVGAGITRLGGESSSCTRTLAWASVRECHPTRARWGAVSEDGCRVGRWYCPEAQTQGGACSDRSPLAARHPFRRSGRASACGAPSTADRAWTLAHCRSGDPERRLGQCAGMTPERGSSGQRRSCGKPFARRNRAAERRLRPQPFRAGRR